MRNKIKALTYAGYMRGWGPGLYTRPDGLMMPGAVGRFGQWAWVFVAYHVAVSLLILLILILIVVLLWKKIQMMDHVR